MAADSTLTPTKRTFLLIYVMQLRPLLRPPARRELAEHVKKIETDEKATDFGRWANDVITAHRLDGKRMRGGRAERIVRADLLRIFNRPQRAFRVRWLF